MRTEFYEKLRGLLLTGESPTLESSLEPGHLGEERLRWSGGTLGALPEGRTFCQTLSAPARLVICGGGHVARCLAPAARAVGFQVTVLENRPEVLAEGTFGADIDCRCGDFVESLQGGAFGPNAFFAIMTRGHQDDWVCLKTALALPHGYVGMMGSRSKVAATRKMLAEKGFDAEAIDSVHSPIGLKIGAETPAEIAVSIVAELIRCRHMLGLEAPLTPAVINALGKMPYAMVTLVNCEGSTPRSEGARMLVFPDGSIAGTIGGGISEASAKRDALRALAENAPMIGHYALNSTGGAVCGGKVEYLIIPVQ